MGYKTKQITNTLERRTYVQGLFTGKYHGIFNDVVRHSDFECYDIHLYEGELTSLKNDKEHSNIINETIYDAIVSETQLTQSIFENILVKLDTSIQGYDSFKLAIKKPKLECVQIFDVEKDGNQTFGTLVCLVSGYLLSTKLETVEVFDEICDNCNQFLEHCKCFNTVPINFNPIEEKENPISNKVSFWKENFKWSIYREEIRNWGCLGWVALLITLLFLFSFGLPGILVGAFLALFYISSIPFYYRFPVFFKNLKRLIYIAIGLLLFGCLFYFLSPDRTIKYWSFPNKEHKTPVAQEKETNRSNLPLNPISSQTSNQVVTTSNIEKPRIDNESKTTTIKQIEEENQNLQGDTLTFLKNEIDIKHYNKTNIDTTALQNSTLATRKNKSSVLKNSESENQGYTQNKNEQSKPENLITKKLQNIESNFKDREQNKSEDSYSKLGEQVDKNDQQQINSKIELSVVRQKQNKVTEIISGIEFHEGDVYICKDKSSKFYHFNPECTKLSTCSTPLYKINIPVALNSGYSLCELEE